MAFAASSARFTVPYPRAGCAVNSATLFPGPAVKSYGKFNSAVLMAPRKAKAALQSGWRAQPNPTRTRALHSRTSFSSRRPKVENGRLLENPCRSRASLPSASFDILPSGNTLDFGRQCAQPAGPGIKTPPVARLQINLRQQPTAFGAVRAVPTQASRRRTAKRR